jgi:hypothetical protein
MHRPQEHPLGFHELLDAMRREQIVARDILDIEKARLSP